MAKGLSKYRLAKLSGISETYLYQLENGTVANPRGDTLMSLAKGLGVSISQLLGEEIHEARAGYDLVGIKVRGAVPAGGPWPSEEQPLGYIEVPRGELTDVQSILGHKTLDMTRRYLATINSEQAAVRHHKFSPVDNLGK